MRGSWGVVGSRDLAVVVSETRGLAEPTQRTQVRQEAERKRKRRPPRAREGLWNGIERAKAKTGSRERPTYRYWQCLLFGRVGRARKTARENRPWGVRQKRRLLSAKPFFQRLRFRSAFAALPGCQGETRTTRDQDAKWGKPCLVCAACFGFFAVVSHAHPRFAQALVVLGNVGWYAV